MLAGALYRGSLLPVSHYGTLYGVIGGSVELRPRLNLPISRLFYAGVPSRTISLCQQKQDRLAQLNAQNSRTSIADHLG